MRSTALTLNKRKYFSLNKQISFTSWLLLDCENHSEIKLFTTFYVIWKGILHETVHRVSLIKGFGGQFHSELEKVWHQTSFNSRGLDLKITETTNSSFQPYICSSYHVQRDASSVVLHRLFQSGRDCSHPIAVSLRTYSE